MSQPIVLWDARRHTNLEFDDAGVSIAKTVLAPQVAQAPYTEPANNLTTGVPPLAYFCIRALTPYVDQLHNLRHPIPYREQVVRPLLSRYDQLDVKRLDPRLWATLAQVMHPLPAEFRDYQVPLSDIHLPLLQQVPSRDNFCFVTLLALPGCKEVSDDTIHVFRRLDSLAALDLRGTSIGSYGLGVLARSLSWTDHEIQSRTGCWGLRILSLHSCINIANDSLPIFSKFPLLSSLDLRFTRCTPRAISKHLAAAGFMSSSNTALFHPAPIDVSLTALELLPSQDFTYSCPISSVFKLHISKLNHPAPSRAQRHSLSSLHDLHNKKQTNLVDSDDDYDCQIPESVLRVSQGSTTSSFYASCQPRKQCLIRAAAVDSTGTDKGQLDLMTLARPPPPWNVLDALQPPERRRQSHDLQQEPPPIKLASMDRARLAKRNLTGVQDMVTSLATKNETRRADSAFTSTSGRLNSVFKPSNPFLKSRSWHKESGGIVRSVFAAEKAAITPTLTANRRMDPMPKFCDARAPKAAYESSDTTKFPPARNSHPTATSKADLKISAKPLRPITSFPIPPCPIEHLMRVPQLSMKRKRSVQTQLAFPRSRDECDDGAKDEASDFKDEEAARKRVRLDRSISNTGKKGKQKDWDEGSGL